MIVGRKRQCAHRLSAKHYFKLSGFSHFFLFLTYALLLPLLLRIMSSSSIVSNLDLPNRLRTSEVCPKAIANFISDSKAISPFCSNRATVDKGTPDSSEMCCRVMFFSTRLLRKFSATSRAISSELSRVKFYNTDNILLLLVFCVIILLIL